jgi:hypothetical protein
MHAVKRVPVPQTQVTSFLIGKKLNNISVQLIKASFQISILLCRAVNLKKGIFTFSVKVFIQNLNQQFCDQTFDLGFVVTTYFMSFSVHRVDIRLVSVAQLIHSFDQIVSLVCQILQLLVH